MLLNTQSGTDRAGLYTYEEVQVAAAGALGRVGNTSAVSALIEALEKTEFGIKVRIAAAQALGQIADPQVVPVLVKVLQNSWAKAEVAIVEALAQFDAPLAISTLGGILFDTTVGIPVRSRVAGLLASKSKDTEAVLFLTKALQERETEVRWAAAIALGQIGEAQAVPVLEEIFWNTQADDWLRQNAVQALSKTSEIRAASIFKKALIDTRGEVRKIQWSAALELGRLGDKAAIPVLVEILKNAEKYWQRQAAEMLGRVHEMASVYELTKVLIDTKTEYGLRQIAFNALVEIARDTRSCQ